MPDEKAPEQKTEQPPTISVDEFNRIKARAERFEAQAVDWEKKFKGVDIEALKAAAEERDILRKQVSEKDWKAEDIMKEADIRAEKRYSSKLTELQTERDTLASRLKDTRVVSTAIREAAAYFNADSIPLIESVIRRELDLDKDDEIIVKDERGEPRYSKADPRQKMAVKEYLEELAGRFPSCAKSEMQAGAKNAANRNGNSTPSKKYDYAELKAMTAADQKRVMATMKPEELRALFSSK